MSHSSKTVTKTHFNNFLVFAKNHIPNIFKGDATISITDNEDKVQDHFKTSSEFATYERSVANKLGFFGISATYFHQDVFGNYILKPTVPIAQCIYWSFRVNTFIKSIFLMFLVLDYFGPVVFLDKIAALDYILCVGIATLGAFVWGQRYPMHEIIQSFWSIKNLIFKRLRYPEEIKMKVESYHRVTVWIHLVIVWFGCSCLIIQFYADPKYCTFTYSSFELDLWWLRIIFCAHEFFFMMQSWNVITGTCSLCSFKGVSLSNLIDKMTEAVRALCNEDPVIIQVETSKDGKKVPVRKFYESIEWSSQSDNDLGIGYDSIDKLIFDYKQLIIITDRFNESIAYKLLLLHIGVYCQCISDVFVAIQVLKLGGTFADVWFYVEDCFAGAYMIYRIYTFMSGVAAKSEEFLRAFLVYRSSVSTRNKLKLYTSIARSLKVVALRLGPLIVTPVTVLTALDTFGNYYVCVALW